MQGRAERNRGQHEAWQKTGEKNKNALGHGVFVESSEACIVPDVLSDIDGWKRHSRSHDQACRGRGRSRFFRQRFGGRIRLDLTAGQIRRIYRTIYLSLL